MIDDLGDTDTGIQPAKLHRSHFYVGPTITPWTVITGKWYGLQTWSVQPISFNAGPAS